MSQATKPTHRTLVSAGTERMLVEFGKAELLTKARQQPDKVRTVLDKIRTDGLQPTMEAVFNKLDLPLPLAYCNVGRVLEVEATSSTVRSRVPADWPGAHAPDSLSAALSIYNRIRASTWLCPDRGGVRPGKNHKYFTLINRRYAIITHDICMVVAAWWLVILIHFNFAIAASTDSAFINTLPVLILI